MRALGAVGTVPFARVLREHRAWIVPLAVVLIINLGLLVGVLLPLSRASASSEQRARTAQQALQNAEREFKTAEATREGQSTATRELETFYKDVLPKDARAAARLTHVKLAQLAEKHGIVYSNMSASPSRERDSTLEHLSVSLKLAGDYDAIRSFLHEVETSPDFIVIDNMVLGETGGAGESAELSLNLEVSTYYLAGANGS